MSKRVTRRSSTTKRPKTKLGLPDLDHSKAAVLDSLRSPESKRGYRHAIDEYIQWYCSEPRLSFSKVVVTRFRICRAGTCWGTRVTERVVWHVVKQYAAKVGLRVSVDLLLMI